MSQRDPKRQLQFEPIILDGFGDRHNSWAWSLLWWKGKLYATTNRAFYCVEQAGLNYHFPLLVRYPPRDPDVECAPDFSDMPLQAEIWRWAPETDAWERVYQSPLTVPNPYHRGKFLPQAIGFRGMTIFTEADGTEALYVTGVNTRFMFRPVPPPQILRSTDGETFTPVPQDAGTFLGDIEVCSFRTPLIYQGRLYVQAGSVRGEGVLLESANPQAGNDAFRQITPPGVRLFDMAVFGDYLYLGLRYTDKGYAVYKTKGGGSPYCQLIPVITAGAYHPEPSMSVISMCVFGNRLYVGTDRPAEIIRVNPDDTWDLVVGAARQTPDGWKAPLSSLDAGFSNWLNAHIWRMYVHEERLYIGTWNMSAYFRHSVEAAAILDHQYGFDLYTTDDGWHFTPVTTNGFGQPFNEGLRSFATTPYGLYVGTVNAWYGLQIWRGAARELDENKPAPAQELAVAHLNGKMVVSWTPAAGTVAYRVYRAEVRDERRRIRTNRLLRQLLRMTRGLVKLMPNLYLPSAPKQLWIPGKYSLVGTAQTWYYVDESAEKDKRYLYWVEGVDAAGNSSEPSNIAAYSPDAALLDLTGAGIRARLEKELGQGTGEMRTVVQQIYDRVAAGDKMPAATPLAQLEATGGMGLDVGARLELQCLLRQLQRRLALNQVGFIRDEQL